MKIHKERELQPLDKFEAKFAQGVALWQKGKLAEANRIIGEVVRLQPNNFNALHLLGITACQTLQPELGAELITRAIKLNGDVADARSNLGNALRTPRRFNETSDWRVLVTKYRSLGFRGPLDLPGPVGRQNAQQREQRSGGAK
jgi:tetratricopeptide (TPR) repeat protein